MTIWLLKLMIYLTTMTKFTYVHSTVIHTWQHINIFFIKPKFLGFWEYPEVSKFNSLFPGNKKSRESLPLFKINVFIVYRNRFFYQLLKLYGHLPNNQRYHFVSLFELYIFSSYSEIIFSIQKQYENIRNAESFEEIF